MRFLKIGLAIIAIVIGVPAVLVGYLVLRITLETRHDRSIVSSGVTRTYQLYVPKSVDPKKAVPLVISMHAAAGWPQLQRDLSQWDRVADAHGFIVAYPRGGKVPSTWDVDRGPGLDRDVRFISDLIDTISANYAIDPTRIYANGLSNGGGMSFVLACKLHSRIAAVGIVSGAETLPFEWCTDPAAVPAVIIHGVKDKIVPYIGGPLGDPFNPAHVEFPSVPDFAASWARKNGCSATPMWSKVATDVVLREYVDCTDSATVDFYSVADGGHQWPGGKPIPEWWVGPFTNSVDASAILWEFFERHPMRASVRSPARTWLPVERSAYAWRAGTAPYQFIVEALRGDSSDDEHRRLRIAVPGHDAVVIAPSEGLGRLFDSLGLGAMDRPLLAGNLVKSNYAFLSGALRSARGEPLLLVFGFGGEDPSSLQVFALDAKGVPTPVFEAESFYPVAFTDLDGDGQREMVGLHSFAQAYGSCQKTYDPYDVYRAPARAGDSMRYDSALSEDYTRKELGGWAGRKTREDVAVVECDTRHPRVVDAKDSSKVYP